MTPCSCGSDLIGDVIGIFWLADRVPHHVSFNCVCGTTRGIAWEKAPQELRAEAILAEQARMATEGWI